MKWGDKEYRETQLKVKEKFSEEAASIVSLLCNEDNYKWKEMVEILDKKYQRVTADNVIEEIHLLKMGRRKVKTVDEEIAEELYLKGGESD